MTAPTARNAPAKPNTPAGLRMLMRRLAEWPPVDLPVVSAYLDLRPQATGQRPALRSGEVVLRDRLREMEREFDLRSPARESFSQSAERIRGAVDDALPEAQGLAAFCGPEGLAWAVTREELDNSVTHGPRARLLPLARLADVEQALIALADTNTLRMFHLRAAGLVEAGMLDDDTTDYSRHDQGGWSQARFQRHIDEHRAEFAELAAAAIDEEAARDDASIILLAGDEVALPLIEERLPQRAAGLLRGTLRIDMRATLAEIEDEVLPKLRDLHNEVAFDAVRRLVDAVKGDGMGVGGLRATREALDRGQVGELVLDPAQLDDDDAEALIHAAALTDARVRLADEAAQLRELGGVGGLLRFRLDRPINPPNEG